MDTILSNISDPAWWFNAVLLAVIAYLVHKFIQSLSSIPTHAKGVARKWRLKSIRKIKNIRANDTKVLVEAIKTST